MAVAWSRIRYGGEGDKETGAISGIQYVEPGDEVDAGKLGVSDEEFQELVDSGAVRDEAYPEDVPSSMSVRDFSRQQAAEAGNALETTGGTLMLSEVEQMMVAQAAQAELENAEEVKPEETSALEEQMAHTPILKDAGGSKAPAQKPAEPASSGN